jgi:NADPH2:quinone reductase
LSNLNPIITVVTSKSTDFVKSLNAADYIIDYRKGGDIKDALAGKEIHHAFDAICANRSWERILAVPQSSNDG